MGTDDCLGHNILANFHTSVLQQWLSDRKSNIYTLLIYHTVWVRLKINFMLFVLSKQWHRLANHSKNPLRNLSCWIRGVWNKASSFLPYTGIFTWINLAFQVNVLSWYSFGVSSQLGDTVSVCYDNLHRNFCRNEHSITPLFINNITSKEAPSVTLTICVTVIQT